MHISEELRVLPIDLIRPNKSQPRRHFAKDEIAQLAASIKAVGLIHPPLVQELSDGQGFELISGERRLRACREAGLTSIRVLVRQGNSSISAQLALIENVQRVDLNALEVARSLQKLIDEFGLTQRELTRRIAKKRSTIANYLRLLTLPITIQQSLQIGKVSTGHAKAILSLSCPNKQEKLHQDIILRKLTVRQAELAAKGAEKKEVVADEGLHLRALEERIQQRVGARTEIRGKGTKGQVVLHYQDLDDLDRILSSLGVGEI
ncbi:MAG: ParB/RepB/Spo0J family partition protein [Chlamydiales bacterium]|nr:ParB/RepB/Spo0J family partition protein [Chlamydiales bacterium]